MVVLQKSAELIANFSSARAKGNRGRWGRLILTLDPEPNSIEIPLITNSATETEVVDPAAVTSPLKNLLTIAISSTIDNLFTITIDNSIYQLSNLNPPPPGYFNYNNEAYLAIVTLLKPVSNPLVVINSTKLNSPGIPPATLRKNNICRLSPSSMGILAKYNANAAITINRRFSEHASMTFTFTACKSQEAKILSTLYNGYEFYALGLRWVIDGVTVEKQEQHQQLAFSINCKDYLAGRGNPSTSKLDRRVFIRSALSLSATTAGNKASIRGIASLAGISYQGNEILFRVPRSTSSEETITVRDLLTNRAIVTNGFPYYSNPNAVENRNWYNTKTHLISSNQVRTKKIQYNYQGHGSLINGVRLHTEYRNLEVNLDFDADSQDGFTGTTERWVFDNCRNYGDMVTPNEYRGWHYTTPPPSVLRSPGNCFDAGGPVKSATRIIEMNGTVVFEEHFEYGYAFTTAQTYRLRVTAKYNYITEFRQESPIKYWKLVKHTTTDQIYNREGYLIRIKITGNALTRLQQESEKQEALIAYTKAVANPVKDGGGITGPDPSFLAQAESYAFTELLPINDFTVYELEKHRDYFKDTVKPGDDCDKLWVEPKFVKSMNRNLKEFISKPNPSSTDVLTLPPLITGKFLREIEETEVTSTVFPYKNEKRTGSQNSEGTYFKNSIVLGNVSHNTGKPGVATRLDKTVVPPNTSDRSAYQLYRNQRYFLDSLGVTPGVTTTEGSKGYPDIDSPAKVTDIAETELSIVNTQNALTTQIDIDWRSGIEEGDFAIFKSSRWKILGIEENITISQGQLKSDRLTLSLGYYLNPSLILTNRKYCSGFLASLTAKAIANFTPPVNIFDLSVDNGSKQGAILNTYPSSLDYGGYRYVKYVLTDLVPGDEVTVTITEASFDTYLYLENYATGQIIKQNDDYSTGLLSQIIFTAIPNQTYAIVLRGYQGQIGDYTITATQEPGGGGYGYGYGYGYGP
jgi:hypothetical protein